MEKQIIAQAKWLYAFNGGVIPKERCILQAIQTYGMSKVAKEICIFDINLNEYIEYLKKKI